MTACYICFHIKFTKKEIKSLSYRNKAKYLNYSYILLIGYFSYIYKLFEQNYSFLRCYVCHFN